LPRINDAKAKQAATDYCAQLIKDNVVLSAQSSDVKPYTQAGVAENKAAMTLSVMFAVQACPTDKSKTTVDFKALGKDECFTNMYTAISSMCAQDKTWTKYNADFSLEGGVYENDCGVWSISAK
jgi:hypothetical protein